MPWTYEKIKKLSVSFCCMYIEDRTRVSKYRQNMAQLIRRGETCCRVFGPSLHLTVTKITVTELCNNIFRLQFLLSST